MKKHLYKIVNQLGYKIENKNKIKALKLKFLNQFEARKNINLLYKSTGFIESILKAYPDLKVCDSDSGLIFIFNDIKIFVESTEEIFIINEVFVKKDYNFFSNEKVVLIDIGTNIGISSIFFSLLEHVSKIYAFEPVEATYNQAVMNFELNKGILKVTNFYNYGLADIERKELFLFNKKVKGNTGIRGKLSASFNDSEVEEVQVVLKNATTEIVTIINENLNSKIVIKMDCEGAEYEIFENLNNSGCLNKIDLFLMEWHDKGSEPIESILQKNGFNYISQNFGNNSGMIYANKV